MSTGRILPSMPRRPLSPPRSKGSSRRTICGGAVKLRVAHADFLAWTDKPTAVPGPVNLGEIVAGLRDMLPADAVICNGAGNFSVWVHRYWRYRRYGTQLAPISGSMGYGVPAAIGMKRLAPERTVVAFAGDGDFLMTGQEFATAVQYELPIIVVARRQRHVRHHPHAPGAPLSRPRDGDRPAKPGFRRLRPRLRRPWRDGGEDGGFFPGLRGGTEIRPAGDPSSQGRPRGAHAGDVAQRHPREGKAGG